jgi:hypothetical protein
MLEDLQCIPLTKMELQAPLYMMTRYYRQLPFIRPVKDIWFFRRIQRAFSLDYFRKDVSVNICGLKILLSLSGIETAEFMMIPTIKKTQQPYISTILVRKYYCKGCLSDGEYARTLSCQIASRS